MVSVLRPDVSLMEGFHWWQDKIGLCLGEQVEGWEGALGRPFRASCSVLVGGPSAVAGKVGGRLGLCLDIEAA